MLASLDRPDIWPVKDLGLQVAVQRIKNLKKRPSEEKMKKLVRYGNHIDQQLLTCYGHLMTNLKKKVLRK